ncbi:hypothetical protein [Geitlerinema sp. PCC 9228]|uniref:hypothetical protein n=1 Tax=Geitlerinema sp. PCC 9228 TaxID=111611 RepID=UPI00147DAE7D|nr:hypothetical protein [Geitlerinema sp. PCC 9228]
MAQFQDNFSWMHLNFPFACLFLSDCQQAIAPALSANQNQQLPGIGTPQIADMFYIGRNMKTVF